MAIESLSYYNYQFIVIFYSDFLIISFLVILLFMNVFKSVDF